MEAIFLRHASRLNLIEALVQGTESGLSERGHAEALALCARLAPDGPVPRPTQLLCSPKRRALETLQPLSDLLNLGLAIMPELDERHDGESSLHFDARVRAFTEELSGVFVANDVIWICSHLDWLERAMRFLPSDLGEIESETPFACAEMRRFTHDLEGTWRHQTDSVGQGVAP